MRSVFIDDVHFEGNLMRRISRLAVAAAFVAAAPAFAQQIVKIDGSSTVFPITEAVAE